MSGRDDVDIGYDLAGALLVTDRIMREAVANLNAMAKEGGLGLPRDMLAIYVRSATTIYAADRIADALETVAAETGFVAEALEKLGEVAGPAAGDLATRADRGQGAAP